MFFSFLIIPNHISQFTFSTSVILERTTSATLFISVFRRAKMFNTLFISDIYITNKVFPHFLVYKQQTFTLNSKIFAFIIGLFLVHFITPPVSGNCDRNGTFMSITLLLNLWKAYPSFDGMSLYDMNLVDCGNTDVYNSQRIIPSRHPLWSEIPHLVASGQK